MRRYPTKRLLLFLGVLILPTLAVLVQGQMLASAQQMLAKARSEDTDVAVQYWALGQVGHDMYALLERIKEQEVTNAGGVLHPQPGYYLDPAVIVVGRIDNSDGIRSVRWPWDLNSGADTYRARMKDQPFAQQAQSARQAEAQKQYSEAAGLYRAMLSTVRSNEQMEYARMGHARVLRLTGATADAVAVYRRVLRAAAGVVDEHDVSFASLAAAELTAMRMAVTEVLARAQQEIESPKAMPLAQAVQWRNVLTALPASDMAGAHAAALLARLSERINLVEQLKGLPEIQELKRQFPSMLVTPTIWRPFPGHNGELWLVGQAAFRPLPTIESLRRPPAKDASYGQSLVESVAPLVIVIRVESIRARLESTRTSGGLTRRLRFGTDQADWPVGEEHLPGLKVAFPDLEAEVAASLTRRRSFYGWSFLLVMPLTFLGGYLFWRDTRRELQLAGLRSQFVSSVSHELRTPLTSIRMFAEAMQLKYVSDSRVQQEYLDTIVKESERLTRLLDNVLDFSRIDRDQKRYRMELTPLADAVRSAAHTMRYPLEQQGFTLELNVDETIPPIAVDRDALQQALLNLLTNAMKYSDASRRISMQLAAEGGSAVIRVVDHGIGIPEGEQRRIFEAFYRAAIVENQAIAGTGLGLALVAHFVAAHGGTVRVHSVAGEGSTFSIHLPLREAGT